MDPMGNQTSGGAKPIILVVIAILAVGAYFLFKWKGTATDQGDGVYHGKIKIGHLVALDMAPMFVAKEAGFFKDEGMDVETTFFPNPGDNNAALAGGSLQISINPFTLPYLAENSGIPIRIISSAGGLSIMEVIAQGELNVDSPKALGEFVKANPGKKLKVAALKGDTLEMILYRSFKDNGMSYDNFDMVWFNELPAMVQSFEAKQVDILSFIKPYTTNLIKNNGAKRLTDNSEVWGMGTPNCTAAVMEDFLKKYPKTVESYLKAIKKGFDLIVSNPEKAVDLLKTGGYYKVPPEVLLQAFKTGPKESRLTPNKEGVMKAINDMVAAGYIKAPKTDIMALDILSKIEPAPAK
jgi:ABC-type nitrate/sulfonate/bicarbonate transport system substrate-binding protein